MNIALWVVAGLLAALYLIAGGTKLTQPYEKLTQNPNLGWTNDFSPNAVKAIGGAEVAGALGLILPQVTGIAEWLTPLAAVGLVLLQAGAMRTHLKRGESKMLPVNAVLLLLALVVAIGRFTD
jgi:uncharacterized membrane protein